MNFRETIGARTYRFDGLAALLAKASPRRSGDELAGVAAASEEERVAAKLALAQMPNHAEADQDDMDTLLTLLGAANINFIMGVPGADDIMLNYQSTSCHDALYIRRLLDLKRAPEFEAWLSAMQIADKRGQIQGHSRNPLLLDWIEP